MSTLVLAPLDNAVHCYKMVYGFSDAINPSPINYVGTPNESYPRIINGNGRIKLTFIQFIGSPDVEQCLLFDVTVSDGAVGLFSWAHFAFKIEDLRLKGFTAASSSGGYTSTTDDTVIDVDGSSITVTNRDIISRWTHESVTNTDRATGVTTESAV